MKRLALISHDNKKIDLLAWANYNRETLRRFHLLATATTGRFLREKVGLAIVARVGAREIDAVFFFVDPLTAQPHDPDIQALMRVCNVQNIPLATNLAAADLIITGLTAAEGQA